MYLVSIKYLLVVMLLFFINFKTSSQVRFAAIGDYGFAGDNELAVANLINEWNPDFIITLGDNNYDLGADSSIDQNIGQYYHRYIHPYVGRYGYGSPNNRFFPTLGNHDWYSDSARPYLNYFELPGNERYYDFVWGNVHLFALDSDTYEPDGIDSLSIQALWLKSALQNSQERWKIIYFHHAPFSSGAHGSTYYMNWQFKEWGADLVLSGHDHDYERLNVDGLTYIVNGLGGRSIYEFNEPLPQSVIRYNGNYGALFIEATDDDLICKFVNIENELIDPFSMLDVSEKTLVTDFKLYQNYPNPFNPTTTIKFSLPVNTNLSLNVYNTLGEKVAEIFNGELEEGYHELIFNASGLSSGVYFYKFESEKYNSIKKMILLK